MDPDRETTMEGGNGSISVRHILLVSCVGRVTLWGGDLGFVGSNVQESGGGARGGPQTGDRKDG